MPKILGLDSNTWISIVLTAIAGSVWIVNSYFDESPSSESTATTQTVKFSERRFINELGKRQKAEILEEIRNQYSIDTYRTQLLGQEQRLRTKFTNADLVERVALERELTLQRIKIDSYERSYNEKINLLFEAYQALKNLKGEFSTQNYYVAQMALVKGNTLFAYKLFTQVEHNGRDAKDREVINRAAEAAYLRGNIAKDELNYRKAYRHYRRAVMLNPYNVRYLLEAGKIADSIALYSNAVNYYEAALHIENTQNKKPPRQLRQLWINLGHAWNSKGDSDKAIEYFELALASDIETFGPNHLNVAEVKNNLGLAWENKGNLEKATEYYGQALKLYETKLGLTHPSTLQVKENLDVVKSLIKTNGVKGTSQ
jgi:tetratricopeptide (TPR) repeat protein